MVGGTPIEYGTMAFIATDTSQNGRFAFLDRDIVTERVSILNTGNVGINTTAPLERLHVVGNVRIDGDLIWTDAGASVPDYVFNPDYQLMGIDELEKFIAKEKLLANEYHYAHTLGFEVARTIGAVPVRGFGTLYKRYDVGPMLDLSWRMGANTSDERIAEQAKFVEELQGPYGLWDFPSNPEASRWITFDLLRSLSRLDRETNWISPEPRTPFQAYPKKIKRY